MQKNKYLTFILIAPFILLSCTDADIDNGINNKRIENNKIVLTPEENVSIAYDNPKELAEEEIRNVVFNFQNNINSGKGFTTRNSEVSKISIKKKFYITENNNIIENVTNTRSTTSNELTVPIFEVELSSYNGEKSLAVVCGDERMPEVLFYSENYCPDFEIDNGTRYLLELSKKNILSDIRQIEHIKSTKRDSTLNKIARQWNMPKEKVCYAAIKDQIVTADKISTRNNNPGNPIGGVDRPDLYVVGYVNPMSKVVWSQNAPYKSAMPKMMIFDGNAGEFEGNIPVGCANVAIGMIFSIIKPNMFLDNNQKVDWDYATSFSYINNYSPQDLIDMISGLLAQIAAGTMSVPYREEKELIDIDTESKYTKSVITQTTTTTVDAVNYLRTMANFSGDGNYKFNGNQAKQSLFERKPVLLFGQGYEVDDDGNIIKKAGGHAWLIDGVVITRHPLNIGYYHFWSVNIGWGRGSKAYFRTSNDLQYCDVIFSTSSGNRAYYTQEMTMLYNITKK